MSLQRRIGPIFRGSVGDTFNLAYVSPVPELSSAADVSFITGIGSVPGDGHERMLILVDIDNLISSVEVGLPKMELH